MVFYVTYMQLRILILSQGVLVSIIITCFFIYYQQMPYDKTPTNAMCTMLDIPPISSSIMWARQVNSFMFL